MKLKILFEGRFKIVAIMEGDTCPAETFLLDGEEDTAAYRTGLTQMLEYVAENGLAAASHAWLHEANKRDQIFEFIKGPLRLFFFKGSDGQIAVCTSGVRKKGQKADKHAVARAVTLRTEYLAAHTDHSLEIIHEED